MFWELLGATIGFGVAGLDPVGALIVAAAISKGTSRVSVLAFTLSSMLVTVVVGVILGESVSRLIAIAVSYISIPDGVRWWLQLAIAIAFIWWAVLRLRSRNAPDKPARKSRGSSISAMLLAGALWGVAALSDPTFYGVAALSIKTPGIVLPCLLVAVWFVVSQLPLMAVTVAFTVSADGASVQKLIARTQKFSRSLTPVLTVMILLVALALLVSCAIFLATGQYYPV